MEEMARGNPCPNIEASPFSVDCDLSLPFFLVFLHFVVPYPENGTKNIFFSRLVSNARGWSLILPRPPLMSLLEAGPVETAYGTHLIYLESCNKPENTWKMMFDSIVGKASGKDDEEKQQ